MYDGLQETAEAREERRANHNGDSEKEFPIGELRWHPYWPGDRWDPIYSGDSSDETPYHSWVHYQIHHEGLGVEDQTSVRRRWVQLKYYGGEGRGEGC